MEIKRRKVIIEYRGNECVVEIENGPHRMFWNESVEYCEGWIMPEPLDPYAEPIYVAFEAGRIIRDVE